MTGRSRHGGRVGARREAPRWLAITLIAATMVGCAARKPPGSGDGPTAQVGVYRATVRDADGRDRSFRLYLFVAEPDRLHAEIAPPIGRPRMILDGGGGRLAVTVVAERVAYVGPAERDAMRRSIGLDLSLEELVSALLGGPRPGGSVRVVRVPERGAGLPRRFEISSSADALELRLKRVRPLPEGREQTLGRGEPGDGLEVRDLDELRDLDEGFLFDES